MASWSMERIAALTANSSHSSATLNTVSLAVSSVIRSAKQRASSARWCQYSGSLTSGAMGMERALSRTTHPNTGNAMNTGNALLFLFQIAIMTLIIERMAAA